MVHIYITIYSLVLDRNITWSTVIAIFVHPYFVTINCSTVSFYLGKMPDAKSSTLTEHGNILLKCAQQLLQMCKYVDVALTVQGQRIFCHRLVLASYR